MELHCLVSSAKRKPNLRSRFKFYIFETFPSFIKILPVLLNQAMQKAHFKSTLTTVITKNLPLSEYKT